MIATDPNTFMDTLCNRILAAATEANAAAAAGEWEMVETAAHRANELADVLRDEVRWRLKEARREDRERIRTAVEAAVRRQPLFPLKFPEAPAPAQATASLPLEPVAVMSPGGEGEVIQPCAADGCPAFGVSARPRWRCRSHAG